MGSIGSIASKSGYGDILNYSVDITKPDFTGSSKQVNWANDIFDDMVASLNRLGRAEVGDVDFPDMSMFRYYAVDHPEKLAGAEGKANADRVVQQVREIQSILDKELERAKGMLSQTSAKWWIDNRYSISSMVDELKKSIRKQRKQKK